MRLCPPCFAARQKRAAMKTQSSFRFAAPAAPAWGDADITTAQVHPSPVNRQRKNEPFAPIERSTRAPFT